MDPTFWAALLEPITNTVDDAWYTEGEQAELDAAVTISANNAAAAGSAAAISAQQWTTIGLIAGGLGLGLLLFFYFKNRKKNK